MLLSAPYENMSVRVYAHCPCCIDQSKERIMSFESLPVSWLLKLRCWLKKQYYIQSLLHSLFHCNEVSAAGCLSKPTSEDCQALSHHNVSQADPVEADFFCSTAAEPGASEGNDEEG